MSDKRINRGIASDADTREFSRDDFNHAMRVNELPPAALKAVAALRGKQKSHTKIPVSIRLPADVVEYFKAGGQGWQTRISDALTDVVTKHRS